MTISGNEQLDGLTQGDGSHLVGHTITLNAPDWTEVRIRDGNGDDHDHHHDDDDHETDVNFQDNDGDQRLDGDQIIDGVLYPDGTTVEAEYGLTLSDGENTWEAIGFNLNNSSPAYATVEGLAFIGGPGGFPPVGVPLTVIDAHEGPNHEAAAHATPICFGRGTLIDTPRGARPIDMLAVGELICTRDNGLQPVRWVGGRHALGVGRFAPVEIAAGVLRATAPLRVSRQHRLLLCSPAASLLFGESEVFAPACHLADGRGIRIIPGVRIEYFHILLERHEVIRANGVETETLQLSDMGADTRHFFPELAQLRRPAMPPARRVLRRFETDLLRSSAPKIARAPSLRHTA